MSISDISEIRLVEINTLKYAFSLIEIMVTISIMILLMAVSIPAFQKFGQVAELDSLADNISSGIVEAKTLAMSPPTAKKSTLDSYGVFFYSDHWEIKVGKLGDSGLTETEDIKTLTFSSNTYISNLDEIPTQIDFSIAGQGAISYPSTLGETTLKLNHKKNGNSKNITINLATGQVSVK